MEKLKAQAEGIMDEYLEEFILRLFPPSSKQRTEAILHSLVRLECKNLNMIEVFCWADK